MSLHPLIRKATGLPSDIVEMATRQAVEWDAMVAQMQTLQPGGPMAEDALRRASELLQSMTVNYGPIHGWTLAQHHVIFRAACRMWGPKQLIVSKPNWTESF